MKKISKLVMAFFMGTTAFGLTACSSDDNSSSEGIPSVGQADTNIGSSDMLMQKIAKTYIGSVVNPTYTALALNVQTLNTACEAMYEAAKNKTLSQYQIDEACEAFKNTRREWERSEAFLYGAASDNSIDPHIDTWPLDQTQLKQALNDATLLAGIKGDNPARYVHDHNGDFDSALGFHGLEFVLFRNGANRSLAAMTAECETEDEMTSVKMIEELAFAAAVSADLRNMCFLLEYGWLGDATYATHKSTLFNNCKYVVDATSHAGVSPKDNCYGDYLLKATTNDGYFTTWANTLAQILRGGCSNICNEVGTQKLGQAYRAATGHAEIDPETGDKDSRDYIESPYSKRSFIDYQDNIYSIKNSLYGTRDITATSPVEYSLMKYLQDKNADLANQLNTALNDAIQALETAKNSGIAFVDDPAHAQVKDCIEKVEALDDMLKTADEWMRRQIDE